jgi:hypothetical protein
METRKRELAEAAPIIRDTMYRAVQPLSIEHPDLAASLHQLGVKRFQFLMSKLPKDPGLAFSNLKSLWKPDKVEVEKFSRYYEAYHDPVGVLTRALDTGENHAGGCGRCARNEPRTLDPFPYGPPYASCGPRSYEGCHLPGPSASGTSYRHYLSR